ncbi:hypothetical protein BU25DRAFT_212595 [Macroventuria anomochaeta]|uniref:Uncharacterized protein n=1 Tax=Macroventuria anomochaeta TaxID=301207 RepID=A0ACB6RNB5_9PLEO|nr:uncharacterized protein BU25DRAFT_212595 [Macroventuria anomochaeta]KAF2622432.1 hypothetical protein BU25DRAFT_212595 [Macroventuria anomochaeta]
MIGQWLQSFLEKQSAASSEGAEIFEVVSSGSLRGPVSMVTCSRSAERHCPSSLRDPSMIQGAQDIVKACFFVTLRTRTFHRDHRDHLPSFPTLGTLIQNVLHLRSLASQRTAPTATHSLTTYSSLSRIYPAAVALKLTTLQTIILRDSNNSPLHLA